MVLAGQDKWRTHPFISNCARKPFPGFTLAVGIFTAYLLVDTSLSLIQKNTIKNQHE